MRKNLTEAFVSAINVSKLSEYWDEDVAGFVLRVTPAGSKTWAAYYRHLRRPRKYTIGTWPTISVKAARLEAKGVLHAAQLGEDPVAERKADREALTFGDLAKQYLEGHAKVHKRPSSVYADECMINSDLARAWKNRKAADISNADVTALLAKIVRRGSPIKANRTLQLISKIFRYAIGSGLLPRTTVPPTYLVPRPGKECSRERTLTDDEIKKLWGALADQPAHVAAFFKLLLLTGQRAREVLTMAKAELDFEMGEWTVPANRDDHKGKRENLLPLSPTALALVEALKNANTHPLKTAHPFLFPSRSVKPAPIREYKTWVNALRDELKFEPDWTAHDLRRTLQTNLTKMGISRFIADKITNHADSSVGGVYDRYEYKAEKRAALAAWDARLAEIVAKSA